MLLLLLVAGSFCQITTPSGAVTRDEYLKKSQSRKNLGWVMVGSGVLLGIISVVVAADDVGSSLSSGKPSNDGSIMLIVGGAIIIGSVPFFISAGVNKRKALKASANLKIQKIYIPNATTDLHPFPTLSITLNL